MRQGKYKNRPIRNRPIENMPMKKEEKKETNSLYMIDTCAEVLENVMRLIHN